MPAARPAAMPSGGKSEIVRVAAVFSQEFDFGADALVEGRHERLGARDRSAGIEMQAVQLHHTGIDFNGRQLHTWSRGARDQPRRDRRSNDDAKIRTTLDQRVDDFYRARGMTESMSGDVEDDRSTMFNGVHDVLRTVNRAIPWSVA